MRRRAVRDQDGPRMERPHDSAMFHGLKLEVLRQDAEIRYLRKLLARNGITPAPSFREHHVDHALLGDEAA